MGRQSFVRKQQRLDRPQKGNQRVSYHHNGVFVWCMSSIQHHSGAFRTSTNMVNKSMGNRIRELRSARGLSQAKLAEKAGTSAQQIQRLEAGDRRLTTGWMERIAAPLGVTAADLLPAKKIGSGEPKSKNITDSNLLHASLPITSSSPLVVPVFGAAQGGPLGASGFPDVTEALEWVALPSTLSGIRGIFALYVEGDSMEPWAEHGTRIYIHPTRVPAPRDYVVVVKKSGEYEDERVIVKRLVRRTATKLLLQQYNPNSQIEIDVKIVSKIYRVIPWNEISGS
ncbi:Transcriptional repressor [Granulibacter bethesdensis]|uniref:Transcriptional repressor n=1 Tax=Granulibacter bethesdensis TaxID=364410 RepID=A0AAN1AMN2_9PROT|nr:helix-turn-helix domain-containing protein [Granulibacter bethesdensis]APG30461.1 Transcriptional repressor [Granulibacter bethesdensis]